MSRCPLLQNPFKAAAALSVLFFACGQDPILDAVDEMGSPSAPSEAREGEEGTDEEIEPGVPEEPEPGIPTDPSPGGVAGIEGQAVAGEGEDVAPEEPDPGVPEEPVPGIPEDPEPAEAGSTERPETPDENPAGTGTTLPPSPGVPEDPQPAPPGSPGGAQHDDKQDFATEGVQVLLRGRVLSANVQDGKVRIDLFDGDQRNVAGPRPKVIGVHEMPRPGSFEISVSRSAQRVWLGAYVDLNSNNRPDKGEPSGWFDGNPVHLGDDERDNIEIRLEVESAASGLGRDFSE